MGLFKSKWKLTVGNSTANIYDDKKEFTTLEDVILKSVIQKQVMAKKVIDVAKNGRNVNLARLHRYGRDTYMYGLPDVNISVADGSDSFIKGKDLDNIKRNALKNHCEMYGLDYGKYEKIPDSALPLHVLFAEYIPITAKSVEELEDLSRSSYYAYMSDVTGSLFKISDDYYGEVTFTDNPLIFGFKHEEEEVTPPEEGEDTEEPVEPIEKPKNPLVDRTFTILPQRTKDVKFERIGDELVKVSFPAVEETFLHVIEPEIIDDDSDTTMFWVFPSKGMNTYYKKNDYSNPVLVTKPTKYPVPIVKYPSRPSPINDRDRSTVYMEPINGRMLSDTVWKFHVLSSYPDLIQDSIEKHPNAVDVNTLELFEIPDEAKIEASYNEDDPEDVLTFTPFDVVVRLKSTAMVINFKFTEQSLDPEDEIGRTYEYSEYTEVGAFTQQPVQTGNGALNPPSYIDSYLKGFPSIAFKDREGWRDWLSDDSNPELRKQERTIGRILNIDIKRIAKEVREGAEDNADLIQHSFMSIAVDIFTEDFETRQFIFHYMEFLYLNELYDINSQRDALVKYQEAQEKAKEMYDKYNETNRPFMGRPFVAPINVLAVREWATGYSTRIAWNYILKNTYKAKDSKRTGTVLSGFITPEMLERAKKEHGELPSTSGYAFWKYLEGGMIEEYLVFGLNGAWYVEAYTRRSGGDWSPMEWSGNNKGIYLPLIYGVWKDMLLLQKEATTCRSLQMTVTTAQWQKKKGWMKLLKVVMVIIAIVAFAYAVVAAVSGAMTAAGAGGVAAGGAGAGLGASAIGALVKSMVINMIKSKLVGFILDKVGQAIGFPFLGAIASLVSIGAGGISFNFDAPSLLKFTNEVTSGLGKAISMKLQDIQKDIESTIADFEAQMEIIKEKDEAFNVGNLEPEKILEILVDSPNRFMDRVYADITEEVFGILELDYLYELDNKRLLD